MPVGLSHKMVFTQKSHLQMGMWVDVSFAEVVVDVGGLGLSYGIRKNGSSADIPLLPKASPSGPTLGAKSVTQCS